MGPVIGITSRSLVVPREKSFDRVQALGVYYLEAVLAAGGTPVILPSSAGPGAAEAILGRLDGVLLSGGGDADPRHFGEEPHPLLGEIDPDRDETELRLAALCVTRDLPLFGICRGAQILNVALGGTLVQHLDPAEVEGLVQHDVKGLSEGPGHSIAVEPGTRLAAILSASTARVNSSHHQAVGRLGTGLVVTARARDGVVEAVEHPGRRFILGVQWHPERTAGRDAFSAAIFAAFVAASGGGVGT